MPSGNGADWRPNGGKSRDDDFARGGFFIRGLWDAGRLSENQRVLVAGAGEGEFGAQYIKTELGWLIISS